ncbi:hypothetical protein PPTG_07474 [Phytophthora nicotianae INRA-310]|uniref:Uncharacterized protein n=1 Tax=Phytophthora nicotianae (strain INRA-310) TaxID=761204 RepID=W2QMS0_PHYN3|nr:hypothetical protein PPTG_07474 [Phytophthora nicotianae INRA-310]ETN14423.1 hypothetical protein PPTG_07474 [Phytophthora nicotianae INRA-310]
MVEHVLLSKLNETVEHVLLPKLNRVVEQMWLPTRRTVETLPQSNEAVEHVTLSRTDMEVELETLPQSNEAVEHVPLPRTDMEVEDEVVPSPDDENSSVSSSCWRRSEKSKRKKSSRGRLNWSRYTPPCWEDNADRVEVLSVLEFSTVCRISFLPSKLQARLPMLRRLPVSRV